MARRRKVPKIRNSMAKALSDPLFKQRVVEKPRPRDYRPEIKDFDDD